MDHDARKEATQQTTIVSDASGSTSILVVLLQRLLDLCSRIWSGISRFLAQGVEYFRTLLRSVGLGILTFVRGANEEPPKVLIDSSWQLALARCAIHIVPATLSIGLVVVNLSGYFIGNELEGPQGQQNQKISFLQVAAKMQELLIVSSVGTVIFHVLRSELVFGDGVPFGLLVSGWSFSQLSYFWSAEFWGGALTKNTSAAGRWKRLGFVVLVMTGGALAIVAGPAAAVLMIPTVQDWPVGGGIFWLNGSDAQLFPNDLNADYYSDMNCSSESTRFPDPQCPSAGFMPLYQHYTTVWNDQSSRFGFEVADFNIRKTMYSAPANGPWANTWAYTAHAATATLQDAMRSLHSKAVLHLAVIHPLLSPEPLHLTRSTSVRHEVKTKAPAVRTQCRSQGVLDLGAGNLTVEFPNFEEYDVFYDLSKDSYLGAPKVDTIDVSDDIQQHLFARGIANSSTGPLDSGIFSEFRPVLAIPINTWNFSASSIGIVYLLRDTWARNGETELPPSNVVACSIDARWANARTILEMPWNGQLNHEFVKDRVVNLVNTELDVKRSARAGLETVRPPAETMEKIRLDSSWFDRVAPVMSENLTIATADTTNPVQANITTFEKLLSIIYVSYASSFRELENLLATVVADGLSRSGLIPNIDASRFLEAWPDGWTVTDEKLARTLVRKGDPVEAFSQPVILRGGNSTRFMMRSIYKGYTMSASGWFDYLCIIALLVHALMALVHTIYVVWYGETSGAWDTILELVALTQMSKPPSDHVLTNASAGIRSFKTVKLVAWVEASRGHSSAANEEHNSSGGLQLRLEEDISGRDPRSKAVVGQVYGTEPGGYIEIRHRHTR